MRVTKATVESGRGDAPPLSLSLSLSIGERACGFDRVQEGAVTEAC